MGVMPTRRGQVGGVGIEVLAAGRAVVLRIGEHDFARPPGDQVANIMQAPLEGAVPVGRPFAAWTGPVTVVPALLDVLGSGQVFDPLDPFGRVRPILARP
jgi:hypothetical protein